MALKPVSTSLEPFPDHAALIGDMMLGYGELEFFTLELLAHALGGKNNIHQAARILYRLRGASDRMNVADAILRPFMARIKLPGQYSNWAGAMKHCRMIRNQYAHCSWGSQTDRLWFAKLEEDTKATEGAVSLTYYPLDLSLLKEQQAFFHYAMDLTMFLVGEVRYRTDRRRKQYRTRLPKSRAAPKLHSPLG